MKLGERVRARREMLGMTQEDLANKMGYKSKSSITKIESGRAVTQKIIVKLADALKCSPAYLMGWDEKPSEASFDYVLEIFGQDEKMLTIVERQVKTLIDMKLTERQMAYLLKLAEAIKEQGDE